VPACLSFAVGDRQIRVGCSRWLDADETAAAGLDDSANTRDQPSAADRGDHDVEITDVFEQLEGERPLTGDDVVVVEWRNEHAPVLSTIDFATVAGSSGAAIVEMELPPVAFDSGNLHLGRVGRNHDGGGCTHHGGSQRHGRTVVAGGEGDDAGLPLCRGQLEHPVQRPAELERAGSLEALELDVHLCLARRIE